MEIIRGSLDDISRPASREQTGSRVSSVSLPHNDRICSSTPFSLLVLTNDAADIQIQSSSEESTNSSSRDPDKGQCRVDVTDEEKEEDIKLQRAIEEMRRLDEILSAKIFREKEVRRQRKELQAKLWQELLNRPECHSECAHEALNTKLFLALEAPIGTEEEDNFAPVFETQVPDCDSQYMEKSEKRPNSLTESFEVSHEETGEEQFEGSHCGASKGKKKQKDFVKRNIELVSGEGDQVLLTRAEKERLAELLQEVDEEEEDSARGAGSEEDMWAVSVVTGQGYTPEPSDLEQLIHIDSKIRLLLPVEEFHSVQSSYTNLSLSQEMYLRMRLHERIQLLYLANHTTHVTHIGTEKKLQATNLDGSLHCLTKGHGSEVGWKCDGDPQPGEKVLQDIKERRGQERRLQEIQQQLEILGWGQEMTDESPDLTEEQLLGLLDECELTESWTQDLEANGTTPWDPKKDFYGPDPSQALQSKNA